MLATLLLLATPAVAKDVSLQWDASPSENVTGYRICYSSLPTVLIEGQTVPTEGMIPTCIDAGGALSLLVPNLMDEAIYYFGVVAYNAADQESVLSNIVMSPGFYIPEPPGGLRGTSTVNNVPVPLN